MPRKGVDLTGQKFHRWEVLEKVPKGSYPNTYWRCQCECGTVRDVYAGSLIGNKSLSCGCWKREVASRVHKKHGGSNARPCHPLYPNWCAMKQRCSNPNNKRWHRYGGRGITVCDRWLNSFQAFLDDMGPRPSPDHTIERIDNDEDYCPSNCRWATPQEQARNRRTSRTLTFQGQTKTLVEWVEVTGLTRATIESRLDRMGWDVQAALTKPSRLVFRCKPSDIDPDATYVTNDISRLLQIGKCAAIELLRSGAIPSVTVGTGPRPKRHILGRDLMNYVEMNQEGGNRSRRTT